MLMKKFLILLTFLVHSVAGASADKQSPKFIRLQGSHPAISTVTKEARKNFFSDPHTSLLNCYIVGHEDAAIREELLNYIAYPNKNNTIIIERLSRARTFINERLSDEALTEPAKLFIAGIFMEIQCTEVFFGVIESTRHGEKCFRGKIDLDEPHTSTYYVARERFDRDDYFAPTFQKEAHVQMLTKRAGAGESVDQSMLRKAFTNFLKHHGTFGIEIDHKELKSYLENSKVSKEKLKARL
jgi:hypothetical protein